eukprot:12524531-Ditylum_brightwellii.AAC.1
MKYHMCTAKGVSEKYNVHGDDNPTWGTGQGACESPPKLTFTDNIITKAYNKKAIGCSIWDPMKRIKKKQNQVKFVDNTLLLHNASCFGITAVQSMTQVMTDATLWGRYLW